MDVISTPVGRRPMVDPALVHDPEPPALARALRHLLRRDGDYPAVWRSSRFGAAVDAHRRRGVAPAGGGGAGLARGNDGFAGAVSRLATDPAAVALAIVCLEDGVGHALPPWADLLRASELARPEEAEAGTWFG